MAVYERRGSLSKVLRERLYQRQNSLKIEDLSLTTWGVQGVHRCMADDFAHLCLEMHWSQLLGFITMVYGACSIVFALLFYLGGVAGIGGDIPPDMHSMELCWWFATVNLVTAGFGAMVPTSTATYAVSTAAHLVGLLLNSLLLGVVVAKASLPRAKMVFSNVVCVRTRNGVQQLMVRIGNARGNILYSPDIRFAYIHAVTTEEGETYFEDTHLHVKVPVALKPVFMITHPVTLDSPLNGKSEQDIIKERGFFILIVSATDVETGQSLYARRLYFMKDFCFNQRFKDVILEEANTAHHSKPATAEAVEGFIRQVKTIDFLKFHDTVPLEACCWKEGSEICEPTRRFGLLHSASCAHSIRPASPTGSKPIGRYALESTRENGWSNLESMPEELYPPQNSAKHSHSKNEYIGGAVAALGSNLEGMWKGGGGIISSESTSEHHPQNRHNLKQRLQGKEPSFDHWGTARQSGD